MATSAGSEVFATKTLPSESSWMAGLRSNSAPSPTAAASSPRSRRGSQARNAGGASPRSATAPASPGAPGSYAAAHRGRRSMTSPAAAMASSSPRGTGIAFMSPGLSSEGSRSRHYGSTMGRGGGTASATELLATMMSDSANTYGRRGEATPPRPDQRHSQPATGITGTGATSGSPTPIRRALAPADLDVSAAHTGATMSTAMDSSGARGTTTSSASRTRSPQVTAWPQRGSYAARGRRRGVETTRDRTRNAFRVAVPATDTKSAAVGGTSASAVPTRRDAAAAGGMNASAVERVFRCFDGGNSGFISATDMRQALLYLGAGSFHQSRDIDNWIARMDTTKTGVVNYQQAVDKLVLSTPIVENRGDNMPAAGAYFRASIDDADGVTRPAGGKHESLAGAGLRRMDAAASAAHTEELIAGMSGPSWTPDSLMIAGAPVTRPNDKLTGVVPARGYALGATQAISAAERPFATDEDDPVMSAVLQRHLKRVRVDESRRREDLLARSELAKKCTSGKVQKLFRSLDRSGTGRVSRVDFERGLHLLGMQPSSEDLQTLTTLADPTGSGAIDYEEFRRAVVSRTFVEPSTPHNRIELYGSTKGASVPEPPMDPWEEAETIDSITDVGRRINTRLAGRGQRLWATLSKFDKPKTGIVRQKELLFALRSTLGIELDAGDVRLLQQHLDAAGSGTMSYANLGYLLKVAGGQTEAAPKQSEVKEREIVTAKVKSISELGGLGGIERSGIQAKDLQPSGDLLYWDTEGVAAAEEAAMHGHAVVTPGGMVRIDGAKRMLKESKDGAVMRALHWDDSSITADKRERLHTQRGGPLVNTLHSPGVSSVLGGNKRRGFFKERSSVARTGYPSVHSATPPKPAKVLRPAGFSPPPPPAAAAAIRNKVMPHHGKRKMPHAANTDSAAGVRTVREPLAIS